MIKLLRHYLSRCNCIRLFWTDFFLGGFRWWRRRRGGHWECWFEDPAADSLWHRLEVCSQISGWRPTFHCARDRPCEDYHESLLEKIARQV